MYKIIVASCDYRGIGFKNTLPWNLKEDINYFRKITTLTDNSDKINAIICGRKTWESIPNKFKPLANRINIVISTTMVSDLDQVIVCKNIDDALNYVCSNRKRIESTFVIGGASIYKYFLDHDLVAEIYWTEIDEYYECDTFFPELPKHFELDTCFTGSDKGIPLKFNHYKYHNVEEQNYLNLMDEILNKGIYKMDRTNVGTLSLFGRSLTYDIRNNRLPLLTTKRVFIRGIIEELLFFISGSTNCNELKEKNVHIWDKNTSREFLDSRNLKHLQAGDMGAGYGFQWKHFGAEYIDCYHDYGDQGFNQINYVIDQIKNNPSSRRILMSGWNPVDFDKMALPPCHVVYQFYVDEVSKELSCLLYQRSSDYFLANNYNAVSAVVLTHMLAYVCDLNPGTFTHSMGDVHIYNNHKDQCCEQMNRNHKPFPKLFINPKKEINSIYDFNYEDFDVINYYPGSIIKADMAV